MWRHQEGTALAILIACLARGVGGAESLEFVAEHLPEVAMDNRYASLPLWNLCADSDKTCFGVNAAWSRTQSGTLTLEGPMLALSAAWPLGTDYQISGFAFFDNYALSGGTERRPLDVLFANPPLTMPSDAEFTGLDGSARDVGLGLTLNGSAHPRWIPAFDWSAGLLWQQFELSDYHFAYVITGGPDSGTSGTVDYSATYSHITPFVGAAWRRTHGAWRYAPHVQLAVPLPRRGIQGRITGPGFDLSGNTEDNGNGKHFGDPSVTIGFNVTYEPWNLTLDVGGSITQALLEPYIHKGVEQNLVLSAYWDF